MSNMYAHYLYIFIYVFLISVSSVANLERRVGDERPHLYRVEPIMKENGNNETIKIVENVTTLKDLTTSTVTLFNETSINDITTSQVDNNEQESNASLDNLPNRTDFSTENSDITTVDTDDTQGREYYYSTEDGVSPTVSNYYKKIKNETNSDNNSYNETEATSLDNSTTTETNSSNESDKHTAVSDIGQKLAQANLLELGKFVEVYFEQFLICSVSTANVTKLVNVSQSIVEFLNSSTSSTNP